MITFETDITIQRPISEVFKYVSKVKNNPRWHSAVVDVERVSGGKSKTDQEYLMQRIIGKKKIENLCRVAEYERNKSLTLQATKGPTPFTYKYSFEKVKGGTLVTLHGKVNEEGLPFNTSSFVVMHALENGMSNNLRTLKEILESKESAA